VKKITPLRIFNCPQLQEIRNFTPKYCWKTLMKT